MADQHPSNLVRNIENPVRFSKNPTVISYTCRWKRFSTGIKFRQMFSFRNLRFPVGF